MFEPIYSRVVLEVAARSTRYGRRRTGFPISRIFGSSPNTRVDGTIHSGPRVSFISFTDMERRISRLKDVYVVVSLWKVSIWIE